MTKIRPLKDILQEMAIAGYGDWVPSKQMIGTKSALIVKTKWKFIDKIQSKSSTKYSLYKSPSGKEYIAGVFKTTDRDEEIFEIVLNIKFTEQKSIQSRFKLKNLMNVDAVEVHKDRQGDGIAIEVYKTLVNKEGITILGDETQYFGARRLWTRLSKTLDIIVDIIDIEKDKIIEKDVSLNHGDYDNQFDERVWSYDLDKKDIRLVLTKIKK